MVSRNEWGVSDSRHGVRRRNTPPGEITHFVHNHRQPNFHFARQNSAQRNLPAVLHPTNITSSTIWKIHVSDLVVVLEAYTEWILNIAAYENFLDYNMKVCQVNL